MHGMDIPIVLEMAYQQEPTCKNEESKSLIIKHTHRHTVDKRVPHVRVKVAMERQKGEKLDVGMAFPDSTTESATRESIGLGPWEWA